MTLLSKKDSRNNFATAYIYNKIYRYSGKLMVEGVLPLFAVLIFWIGCLFPSAAFAIEPNAASFSAPTAVKSGGATPANIDTQVAESKSPDAGTRVKAVNSLGRAGNKGAVPVLIEALKDEDPYVRGGAAEALGRLKDARALAPLLEAAKSKDENLRWGAVDGLRRLGDKRAVNPLIALLAHADRNTRWKAAFALGEFKAGQTAGALFKVYEQDGDEFVRRAAAEALGKIGGTGTVERLQSGLAREKNPAVRRKAEFVIKRLNAAKAKQKR